MYDDFLLPGQKEFEKLAKEYLKEFNFKNAVSPKIIDDICYTLKYLEWLYGFVYKNLRIKKLKEIFLKLSNVCENSYLLLASNYSECNTKFEINKKRLNNITSCIKLAIFAEAELIEKLLNLDEKFCQLPCIHLNNIKTLINI